MAESASVPETDSGFALLPLDLRCVAEAASFEIGILHGTGTPTVQCARSDEILDSASLRNAALENWQKIVVAQPGTEPSHIRTVRQRLDGGPSWEADAAAKNGLQVLPKSSSLYVAAAEAMKRQGNEYTARDLLVQGLAATKSIDILSRLATEQDTHGDGAADLYFRLAEASGLTPEKQLAALERGFTVALRDGDSARAQNFAALLEKTGHPEFRTLLKKDSDARGEILIPGGRDGLAAIAWAKNGGSPNEFLAGFARALLANVCDGVCFGPDDYKKSIEDYFATVFELESLGTRDGRRVAITISLENPDACRKTERAFNLLGVEMRSENGAIRLVEGVKRRQAKRQDTVAALAIDIVGIEKALQAGKAYALEITDDPVTVYPSIEMWKQAFPGRWNEDFAETLLHSPQIARLYVSISEIETRTLNVLLGSVSPSELANHFAEELSRYGPAFAVSDRSAFVPGGSGAVPVWAALAGVSPDRPGAFFRALLDTPALLAFFYELSELDARRQAFFTANTDRAMRFYTLSRGLAEQSEYHRDLRVESSFSRFLRSVPLDDNGHVIFPGSVEVWIVAKGTDSGAKRMEKRGREISTVAPTVLEDSVLSHLAETEYEAQGLKNSELSNFVAVSQLNSHLTVPMDEPSAILLAQHYSDAWPLYAYFSDLPSVNQIGLPNFFSIIARIGQKPPLVQNMEMGQLYSLLGWVSILGRTQALSGGQAAQLFSQIGEAMHAAVRRGPMSATSLSLARSVVTMCGQNAEAALDDAVRHCMLADSTEADDPRALDFQHVLELQKAPRLDRLQTIVEAAQHVLSTSGDKLHASSEIKPLRVDARRIVEAASHLPSVKIPANRWVSYPSRQAIEIYDPSAVQRCAADLNDIAGQPEPSLKAVKRAAHALFNALGPQVTAALAAPIYAYYLRSPDLVISEDPLLLRKHRYVDFLVPPGGNHMVERPGFVSSSEGIGSHFVGGFAGFALTAGHAAAPEFPQGGQGAGVMIAAQIAAIRSVRWDLLSEKDQRLAALRILAARECIVQSASEPGHLDALRWATAGVLPPARRAQLLESIARRDWTAVWQSVPLPDLYTLGTELSAAALPHSESSPVFRELRLLEKSGRRDSVNYLGHIPY